MSSMLLVYVCWIQQMVVSWLLSAALEAFVAAVRGWKYSENKM